MFRAIVCCMAHSTLGMRLFPRNDVFMPNMSSDSSVQRTSFQKSWSLSTFSLANVSLALLFLLERKDFLFAHLQCKLIQRSLLLLIEALSHQQEPEPAVGPLMFWLFWRLQCSLGDSAGTTRPEHLSSCSESPPLE